MKLKKGLAAALAGTMVMASLTTVSAETLNDQSISDFLSNINNGTAEGIAVSGDFDLTLTFHNYGNRDKADNYYTNFVIRVMENTDTPDDMYFRADNWSWIYEYETATSYFCNNTASDGSTIDWYTHTDYDGDWSAWLDSMSAENDGCDCTVTITRRSNLFTAVMECGGAIFTISAEPDFFDSDLTVYLTGEQCKLTDISYLYTQIEGETTEEVTESISDTTTESDSDNSETTTTTTTTTDSTETDYTEDDDQNNILIGTADDGIMCFMLTIDSVVISDIEDAYSYFCIWVYGTKTSCFYADTVGSSYYYVAETNEVVDIEPATGGAISLSANTYYEILVEQTGSSVTISFVDENGEIVLSYTANDTIMEGDELTAIVSLADVDATIDSKFIPISDDEGDNSEAENTEAVKNTEETDTETEENTEEADTQAEGASNSLTGTSDKGSMYYTVTVDSADSESYIIVEISDKSGSYIYANSNGTCYYVNASGETTEITDYEGDLLSLNSGESYTVTVDHDGSDIVISFCNEDGEVVLSYTVEDTDLDDEITTTLSASNDAIITINESPVGTEDESNNTEENTQNTTDADNTTSGDSTSNTASNTTISNSNSASPKTGDASPIIPITFAIFGCAAVVFASRKHIA